MKKQITALAIASIAVAASAGAGAATLYTGAWSKHLDGGTYNETHKLIAVEHKGWLAGTFINSYDQRTQVVGYGWDLVEWGHFNFRLYGGATYGYRTCYGEQKGDAARICPAIVPELSYTKYRVQPSVVMLGSAVAVTFKVKF